jgi:hypothetical protein
MGGANVTWTGAVNTIETLNRATVGNAAVGGGVADGAGIGDGVGGDARSSAIPAPASAAGSVASAGCCGS